MKYTILKSFFVASTLSLLAAACAESGAAPEGAEREEVAATSSALNDDGRITGPSDPAHRDHQPFEVCQRLQQKALQSGCVTQGEYNALVRYRNYPSCDSDFTPPLLVHWGGCF